MNKGQKNLTIPIVIIISLITWALFPFNPYGYYTFLRLVCCPLLMVLFFLNIIMLKEHKVIEIPGDLVGWPGVLLLVAIIYNPFIPIHLNREIWSAVNVATIIILVVFWFKRVRHFKGFRKKEKTPVESPAPKENKEHISDVEDARATLKEADRLHSLKKHGESVVLFNKVIEKYEKRSELDLNRAVAKALLLKAATLFQMNRAEEASKTYFDLIAKYERAHDPSIDDLVKAAKKQITKIQPSN